MKLARFIIAVGVLLVCAKAHALDLSENPQRSVLFGFRMGAALDLDSAARSAEDINNNTEERYTADGFLFGLYAGFRFNELVGFEGGWHQSRHQGDKDWGGEAGYSLWHLALRFAIPTPSRQTVVIDLGPAIGSFFFGSVSGIDDNQTFTVGGRAGVTLEHEFGLSMVGTLGVQYLPMYRKGVFYKLMDSFTDPDTGTHYTEEVDTMDFDEDRLVHILWIAAGIQFEWSLR